MRDALSAWQPSPFFFAQREGQSPHWLVLHGTAGGSSASGIAGWFQNPAAQVSTHYVIGQNGDIVQCVDESDGAWANGALTDGHALFWYSLQGLNPNNVTISIEFVKSSLDNSDALTEAQKSAGFPLIKRICQRHSIPLHAADTSGGICGHVSLDPVNRRDCPGAFPWLELWTFLQQEETMQITIGQVQNYFDAGTGGAWHCKQTGYVIGGAILTFYQSFGNSGLCGLTHLGLPISNEISLQGYSGVVTQAFERATLCYDPQHHFDNPPRSGLVYLVHTKDSAALLGDAQIAQLQTSIIDLQHKIQLAQEALK